MRPMLQAAFGMLLRQDNTSPSVLQGTSYGIEMLPTQTALKDKSSIELSEFHWTSTLQPTRIL